MGPRVLTKGVGREGGVGRSRWGFHFGVSCRQGSAVAPKPTLCQEKKALTDSLAAAGRDIMALQDAELEAIQKGASLETGSMQASIWPGPRGTGSNASF